MIQRAAAGHPADFLDLPRLVVAVGIPIGFGLVIIVTALCGPFRVNLGVEGPIGDVEAFDDVGECAALELVGGEPAVAVPTPNGLPHLRFGDLHRQEAFGPEGLLDLLVGHQRS